MFQTYSEEEKGSPRSPRRAVIAKYMSCIMFLTFIISSSGFTSFESFSYNNLFHGVVRFGGLELLSFFDMSLFLRQQSTAHWKWYHSVSQYSCEEPWNIRQGLARWCLPQRTWKARWFADSRFHSKRKLVHSINTRYVNRNTLANLNEQNAFSTRRGKQHTNIRTPQ